MLHLGFSVLCRLMNKSQAKMKFVSSLLWFVTLFCLIWSVQTLWEIYFCMLKSYFKSCIRLCVLSLFHINADIFSSCSLQLLLQPTSFVLHAPLHHKKELHSHGYFDRETTGFRLTSVLGKGCRRQVFTTCIVTFPEHYVVGTQWLAVWLGGGEVVSHQAHLRNVIDHI